MQPIDITFPVDAEDAVCGILRRDGLSPKVLENKIVFTEQGQSVHTCRTESSIRYRLSTISRSKLRRRVELLLLASGGMSNPVGLYCDEGIVHFSNTSPTFYEKVFASIGFKVVRQRNPELFPAVRVQFSSRTIVVDTGPAVSLPSMENISFMSLSLPFAWSYSASQWAVEKCKECLIERGGRILTLEKGGQEIVTMLAGSFRTENNSSVTPVIFADFDLGLRGFAVTEIITWIGGTVGVRSRNCVFGRIASAKVFQFTPCTDKHLVPVQRVAYYPLSPGVLTESMNDEYPILPMSRWSVMRALQELVKNGEICPHPTK